MVGSVPGTGAERAASWSSEGEGQEQLTVEEEAGEEAQS